MLYFSCLYGDVWLNYSIASLRRPSNNSEPGPDGISYRLLKILQDTDLGQAVINDIAYNIDHPTPHPPHLGKGSRWL